MDELFELASDTKAFVLANEFAKHNRRDRDIRRLALALFRSDSEREVVVQRAAAWLNKMYGKDVAEAFVRDVQRTAAGDSFKSRLTVVNRKAPPDAETARPGKTQIGPARPAAPWRPPAPGKVDTQAIEGDLPPWMENDPELDTGEMAALDGDTTEIASNVDTRPVLIVEPDKDFRTACAEAYRKAGYRATAVGTAAAAIQMLRGGTHEPFMALQMEWTLPDMPGVMFLRSALEAGLDFGHTPVVVLSASPRPLLQEFANVPRIQILTKPLPPALILSALAKLVRTG